MIEALFGLIAIQTTIMVAAIPWAYSVHGRIIQVESKLTANLMQADSVKTLETRVLTLELST